MAYRLLTSLFCLLVLVWTPPLVHGQQIPVHQWPDRLTLCGERVPLERQDVWEMMDQAFVSSVYNQPRVILWIKRAHRYFPYLEKRLRERKLPDDLKYVVVVESALKTYATSSAKAVGPWQFIDGTGKRYGLRSDRWIDERYNFERATEAALNYLTDLNKEFKSWGLAIAAYNCGENRMARDLKAQGVSNFYDADLPLETEAYIFSILAAKSILSNPAAYGYSIPAAKRYPPLEYDEIDLSVSHEMPITAIAHACDTTYKIIKEMNPEIRQNALPSGHFKLRIPKGKAQGFNARLTKELSR
ncbi:MAG: lytic transglycosylase domain-containing protein [Deltaproteobacteria bacterium]|nr:lytic transglycosylase domain-containing protein [Deltaproteobacteria bacterium]